MCGIIGVFNDKNADKLVRTGLKVIENRGKDSSGFYGGKGYAIGHALHSIVGLVKQPIKHKGILIANCEIYNWKELNEKYKIHAKNDSDMLCLLLDKKGIEILDELDGVYSFAYIRDEKVIIARDIIGIKPLWYSHSDTFSFASEKKALENIGMMNIIELNPRKVLIYDIKKNKVTFIERSFFKTKPEIKDDVYNKVTKLLKKAIEKRVPERKFGILFSGGVDSSFIALILKKLGYDFECYTAGIDSKTMKEAEDITYAKKAAQEMGLKLNIVKVKEKDVPQYIKKIVPLIEDSNVVKVGVALPFYAACEKARKDGCKVIFSGLGSEEIFAGYERHKHSHDINKECVSGLLKMYERDTYRDDVITMNNNIELRLPFLDKELVRYALRIPAKYKIQGDVSKLILREVALKEGMSEEIALRKKRAAQYGSNFHKAIKKLARKKGFKRISEYLLEFYPKRNVKLGALISGGKDSIYAMYTMIKQNYDVTCMIALRSTNKDSYMFHTPAIDMVRLQSSAIGLPLIEQETFGEKEKELDDLKTVLKKAKEKFGIEGVVTGAIFSNYQRERIEKVADSLSLKIFSPLWHINQETEMREIVNEGFTFIMTKVAADGLNKRWLNKVIMQKEIDELVTLNQRIGMNIAGEGGEFESLVIDGPIFEKKIKIDSFEIVEESEIVAEMIVKSAGLKDKKQNQQAL